MTALPLSHFSQPVRAALLAAGLFFLCTDFIAAAAIDCTQSRILQSARASAPEEQALRMLQEEVAKRTGIRWEMTTAESLPAGRADGGCLIAAGSRQELAATLNEALRAEIPAVPAHAEAFAIRTLQKDGHTTILIAAEDERGVLFGVGMLLRKMAMEAHSARVEEPLDVSAAPEKPLRGHQIGYRAKNNSYDAWTLAQFEQQIRDLAIFGANSVQVIAPNSDDDASSPLFPAPAFETVVGISALLDRYGLRCDLYYPEMEDDYSRAADVSRELARFEALVKAMPRIDALWVPGGDPGHTAPALLLPLVEKESLILHRYHPGASIFLSAQGMDGAHFEEFYHLLATPPRWLNGVFFGPQSRDSFEQQRQHLPDALPMVFYPDIGHTMHAQFPVAQWDPVFALTEGREPIDPRPGDEARIYRHFDRLHIGFMTYSEGVNDDVNKMLWSEWGWSAKRPAEEIVADYARFFLGPRLADRFRKGIEDLEENWRGPLAENRSIEPTLKEFEAMDAEQPGTLNPDGRWRFEMALYRASYDAFLQRRLRYEQEQQKKALAALHADAGDSLDAKLSRAEALLGAPLPNEVRALQNRLFQLGEALFEDAGLQLSTTLYGASNWERGANLDHVDIPLNDRLWISAELKKIRAAAAAEQPAALQKLLAEYDPPGEVMVDDLGNPQRETHLVRGEEYERDPEMYHAAIDGVADRLPNGIWKWSTLSYAEALYETPLALHYEGLDTGRRYRLSVVYAGEDYALPLRLVANGRLTLQAPTTRIGNPQTVEYSLPAEATQTGRLLLEWFRPEGLGGSGRGRQIAEVTLQPE